MSTDPTAASLLAIRDGRHPKPRTGTSEVTGTKTGTEFFGREQSQD